MRENTQSQSHATILLIAAMLTLGEISNVLADTKPVRVIRAEKVGISSTRLTTINKNMQRLIDEKKIPGAVALVARNGEVVHFEAQGLRDIEAELPMQTDTIFRLYSQTKPITGVAVMMLFEEGHFLLSDPISKYLPEFKDMRVYVGEENGEVQTEAARPITIHHLLTHTAGFTYDFFDSPVAKMYQDASVYGAASVSSHPSLQAWTEALAGLPLVSQPGEAWNYGVSMDVLGRLIEVVSGQSFRDFVRARILIPLDMTDTDFYVPDEKLQRFAANYNINSEGELELADGTQNSPYRKLPAIEMGGSGLVGTVSDYLNFAQMLVNKGEYRGKRLLGRKTVEFIMSNHVTPNLPDDPLTSLFAAFGGGRAWGVGFGVTGSVLTNPSISGQPGSVGTFSWGGAANTNFWVDPKENLIGIVHTQVLGIVPISQYMRSATYQAIIE